MSEMAKVPIGLIRGKFERGETLTREEVAGLIAAVEHLREQSKSDSTEVEERTRLRQAIIAAYPLLRRVRDRDVHRVQFFEANAVLGLMDEALKAESPHKPGDVS